MTNYTLWADTGDGSQDVYKIAEHLKKCAGGSVNVLGIGPNVGQSYGLSSGDGTVGVFQTMGCKPGGYYQYEKCIFAWPQWIGNQWMSDENIKNHVIKGEWDWNRDASYNVGGQTAAQWFPQAQYVDLVAGTSPEDVAKKICNGSYVGGSGNTASNGTSGNNDASGVSPLLSGDMTFEELVGDICNGIDSLTKDG